MNKITIIALLLSFSVTAHAQTRLDHEKKFCSTNQVGTTAEQCDGKEHCKSVCWRYSGGTLILTGQPLDTETATFGTKVYTFQTVLTDVDGNVLIGADASASLDNLTAAINLTAGAGSEYAATTTVHPAVSAAAGSGDTLNVVLKAVVISSTPIVLTETLTNGSFNNAVLANKQCRPAADENCIPYMTTAPGASAHTIIDGPLGTQAAADSVSTAPPTDAYYMVSKNAAANTATNPMFVQQTNATAVNAMDAGVVGVTVPRMTLGSDDPAVVDLAALKVLATAIETWNLGTSFADGMNLDSPRVKTAAVAYGYNGATLDMVRVGASKEWHAVDISTRPGENAAYNRREMGKFYSEGYSPAKTTTATVGTAEEEVLASTEILNWPNVTLYLHNTDGADPFTDAAVYVSPDGVLWIPLTWTSCDTAGFGTGCSFELSGHSYRYIKAGVAAADANPVSVDAWITGNRN